MWDVPFTVLQFDYLSLTICCLSLSLTVTKDLKFCFPFLMISQVLFWTQFVKVPTLNCTYYNKFLAQIQLQKKHCNPHWHYYEHTSPFPPKKKHQQTKYTKYSKQNEIKLKSQPRRKTNRKCNQTLDYTVLYIVSFKFFYFCF